jgi:hypothetical protein
MRVNVRKVIRFKALLAIFVSASFPWAGVMYFNGQPFDATVLVVNAILAWHYVKEQP